MCTVVVEVPAASAAARGAAIRVLAVRDEDPARLWDPPGEWWPDRPGVIGVRDRRAGGAWLATADGRLSVILNRVDVLSAGLPAGPNGLASRGSLVLDAVAGHSVPDHPQTAGFNLVTIADGAVHFTSWDGETLVRRTLGPGVHMIAHHDVDDPRSARITAWLPAFSAAAGHDDDWREQWLAVLEQSTELSADDDRAIIRDNRPHGYETLSLLVCTAEVRSPTPGEPRSVDLRAATLAEPAVWGDPTFRSA